MNVSQHIAIPFRLVKVTVIFLSTDRFPMAQVIVPHHVNPFVRQIPGKFVIPVNVLHHPVTDLQDPCDLPLRDPLDGVDPGGPVPGRIGKLSLLHVAPSSLIHLVVKGAVSYGAFLFFPQVRFL